MGRISRGEAEQDEAARTAQQQRTSHGLISVGYAATVSELGRWFHLSTLVPV